MRRRNAKKQTKNQLSCNKCRARKTISLFRFTCFLYALKKTSCNNIMNDVVLHKQTTSRATERVDLLSFFYFSLHFLSCSHISPCGSPLSFFLLLSLSVNLLIIRVFLHLTFILLNFSLSRLSNFYQHPLNQYCATAV